jgi:hypothetical protein
MPNKKMHFTRLKKNAAKIVPDKPDGLHSVKPINQNKPQTNFDFSTFDKSVTNLETIAKSKGL